MFEFEQERSFISTKSCIMMLGLYLRQFIFYWSFHWRETLTFLLMDFFWFSQKVSCMLYMDFIASESSICMQRFCLVCLFGVFILEKILKVTFFSWIVFGFLKRYRVCFTWILLAVKVLFVCSDSVWYVYSGFSYSKRY